MIFKVRRIIVGNPTGTVAQVVEEIGKTNDLDEAMQIAINDRSPELKQIWHSARKCWIAIIDNGRVIADEEGFKCSDVASGA